MLDARTDNWRSRAIMPWQHEIRKHRREFALAPL